MNYKHIETEDEKAALLQFKEFYNRIKDMETPLVLAKKVVIDQLGIDMSTLMRILRKNEIPKPRYAEKLKNIESAIKESIISYIEKL